MTALPIITYFRTETAKDPLPEWALFGLLQAKITNPESRVILITNHRSIPQTQQVPILGEIELVDAEELDSCAKHFREIYFHMSPNNFHHERSCIERWFLVHELAKTRGFDKFFFMDCDVLLYSNVTEASHRFSEADATMINDCSWGTAFFNNSKVLGEFTGMVIEAFERRTQLWNRLLFEMGLTDPLKSRLFTNMCDMFLITAFVAGWDRGSPRNIIPCDRPINGRFFDPHINVNRPLPGVLMSGEQKQLFWSRGQPYVRWSDKEAYLKMDCVHFQGKSKGLLPQLFSHGLHSAQQVNESVESRIDFTWA